MSRVVIPYTPHRHQLAIHQGLLRRRYGVLVCHRRFGKTMLAVNALIDAAIRSPLGDGRFGYVAPYLTQATQIAWTMLKAHTCHIPGVVISETLHQVTMPNSALIRLYGADNPDSMRGLYFDGVVVDEVADVKPNVWGEILRPAISDRKGWALFIGTPKGVNLFSELYQTAVDQPEEWFSGLYRADETNLPWLPPEELESCRATMPPNAYRQEYLCDFGAASDNALITIDQVSAAVARNASVKEVDQRGLPVILGVDVARFGSDRTVIFRRQGLACYPPVVLQGEDNMAVAGRLASLMAEHNPEAVFIDVGGGQGIIDRLRQLGHRVTEVNFGSKADDPLYANKRAEMWDRVRQWLDAGGALPLSLPDLKTDLCAPTYKYDAANRLLLEAKDDLKKRGLRSPDLADALALTFAYPVAMRRAGIGADSPAFAIHDFDPFQEAANG